MSQALVEALGAERVRRQEALAPYTTFKIGGPADLFYEPTSADELARKIVLAWLETPFEGGRHERRIALLDAPPAAR